MEPWAGNQQLRELLAPAADLRTHPKNPRRGDLSALTASLRRFGQQRPILALPDGTIVAGNHTYRAALELGWEEIAVIRSDLADAEIDAYLAADNRTGELGGYDPQALYTLLEEIGSGDLEGTGYEPADLDDLLAELQAEPLDALLGRTKADKTYAEFREGYLNRTTRTVMLEYPAAVFEWLAEASAAVREERGLESNAEMLLVLVAEAAGREVPPWESQPIPA